MGEGKVQKSERETKVQFFLDFFLYRLEIPFLGKFHPKNQICQFQLKFGTTNLNKHNSMVMFTVLFKTGNTLFW